MNTDRIQINNKFFKLEDVKEKLNDPTLQEWEKGIYEFILNWFGNSDFILQKTSGSTGAPKEIKLKKSSMLASATNTLNFFHLQKDDTAWLCLPIDYIAGKMMVVRAIVGHLNLLLTTPEGTPHIPAGTIDFTAMVPLQVKKLIDENADFTTIKKLIIGGAAVDYSLQKAIQSIPAEVYATYGTTETYSHIALQRLNGLNPDQYFRVLEGITISSNKQNCLVIDAPDLSDIPFQTTDIVELISSSEFSLLGRSDNVINTGGLKISPELLEKEISVIIGGECLIVPETDELLGQKLILVLEGEKDESNSKLVLEQIKRAVGKHRTPKAVYYVESFPRNESMKIDRKKVIETLSLNH